MFFFNALVTVFILMTCLVHFNVRLLRELESKFAEWQLQHRFNSLIHALSVKDYLDLQLNMVSTLVRSMQ
jgi:hypothetical protein